VLRFWETRFSFIRPMKRAGGRRFYRPQDLAVLRGVRVLLHDEGYTIKGVQKLHRAQGLRRLVAAGQPAGSPELEFDFGDEEADPALSGGGRDRLEGVLEDLITAKARLDEALGEG
jgi:DNA-binding transcriptional MerR regulator